MHKAKDPQEIPLEIFAIEGQKNVFQIHFNETGKTTDFVLAQVFNKKKNHKSTATAIELHAGNTIVIKSFSLVKHYIYICKYSPLS